MKNKKTEIKERIIQIMPCNKNMVVEIDYSEMEKKEIDFVREVENYPVLGFALVEFEIYEMHEFGDNKIVNKYEEILPIISYFGGLPETIGYRDNKATITLKEA